MATLEDLRKPQKFVVSNLGPDSFKPGGQRANSVYRDLGIAEATNGAVKAHVVKNLGKFDKAKVGGLHSHGLEFHLVYLLRGWIRMKVEGHGVFEFTAGTCWNQPPGLV